MFSLAPGCRRPPGEVTAWFMTSSARLNWTKNQEKKFRSAFFFTFWRRNFELGLFIYVVSIILLEVSPRLTWAVTQRVILNFT